MALVTATFWVDMEDAVLMPFILLPYLLVVVDRQSLEQKLRYDTSMSHFTYIGKLVRAVICQSFVLRNMESLEQHLPTKKITTSTKPNVDCRNFGAWLNERLSVSWDAAIPGAVFGVADKHCTARVDQ
jgi:hypothetical protein